MDKTDLMQRLLYMMSFGRFSVGKSNYLKTHSTYKGAYQKVSTITLLVLLVANAKNYLNAVVVPSSCWSFVIWKGPLVQTVNIP